MFVVEGKTIGKGYAPFVVAELSGNHNQDIQRAYRLIDAAADAGADAVKLQTYTADTMTLNLDHGEFLVDDPNNPWCGYTLHQLYDEAHTPWEWHQDLFDYIRQKGMVPFSSPFDESAVDFLESLDCPIYKIASFEMTDIPLLRKVASTGKPMIVSTGMATQDEIEKAINEIRQYSSAPCVFLKCTSTYPADPVNTNLITMLDIEQKHQVLVGLSDHTMGGAVAVSATAMGACVIEKHLTLKRSDGGVDASFSMEPEEFKTMVNDVSLAFTALGKVVYGGTQAEQNSKMYRRSIYFVTDKAKGEVITHEDIAVIRPALGLEPVHYESLIGRVLQQDVHRGTATRWDLFE